MPLYSLKYDQVVGKRKRRTIFVATSADKYLTGVGSTAQEAILDLRKEYRDTHKGAEAIKHREIVARLKRLFRDR